MIAPHGIPKDRWPSEEETLRAVAEHGEIVICQFWDKASKEYRRIYTQTYKRFMEWAPEALGDHSNARICLVLSADPLRFIYLVRAGGIMNVCGPQPWAPVDMADYARQALALAKKGHTGSVLANQAWRRAWQHFPDFDQDEFKRRFGGALAGFRDELNPERPHFLQWEIVERGPPDAKVQGIEYTLPKPLTLKEYEQFRENKA